MNTYVILRRHGWNSPAELDSAAQVSGRVGTEEMSDRIRWLHSHILKEEDGTLGTVCVYQATDEEAVREHARRASLPCDEILPVVNTVVVNAEPALGGSQPR
jgi:hypothetical protein